MSINTDIAKVLAAKIHPRDLNSFRCASTNILSSIALALDDDYTYKGMTEELLRAQLPDFQVSCWKDVYDYFMLVSSTIMRIPSGLFSDNPDVVKISLYIGVDITILKSKVNILIYDECAEEQVIRQSKRNSLETVALIHACKNDYLESFKVLFASPNVDINLDVFTAAYKLGDSDIMSLIIKDTRFTPDSDSDIVFECCIRSNNLYIVKLFIDEFDLDVSEEADNPIISAIDYRADNVLEFFLDNMDLDVEEVPEKVTESSPSENIIRIVLAHPRTKDLMDNYKSILLTSCISSKYFDLVDELLQDKNLDISDNSNDILSASIEARKGSLLKRLLRRPDVNLTEEESLFFLVECRSVKIMNILLSSTKVRVSANSSVLIEHLCRNGKAGLLNAVLSHKRVVVSKKTILKCVNITRNSTILDLLSTHPRTKDLL